MKEQRLRWWGQVGIFLVVLALAAPVLAQDPPSGKTEKSEGTGETTKSLEESIGGITLCKPGECCPPTMAKKITIGVATLVILVGTFFFFTMLMQRRFIRQRRNATLGKHLGISLSLFITSLGLGALVYLITSCWPPEFWVWIGFVGGVWLLHLIYTMAAVRD